MYVITGATGNTGSIIASTLLGAGKQVRIIARDTEKAKGLIEKGAELFQGSTNNVELLKAAFAGADAVYVVIPMNMQAADYTAFQMEHVNAIAEAMETCNVKKVVSMSSQGAHINSGSGIILGLHYMEGEFNQIEGLNTLNLRPSYFMENTLGMVGMIKDAGIMGSPIKADLSFPMIATKDIANYAAKRLLALDFEGNNHQDLLGARNITYAEVAKVYGAAIGKPDLNYVQFPYADFKAAFMGMGASESVADKMNEFLVRVNAGEIFVSERNEENTTPTTIEEFSQTFSYVYNM
ncbi:MAG: NAD(P)H-binding protein [Chlorobi bacterium]|nr:NAD(P)H-binding protein [Chlorobiota bacterium]